MQVSNRVSQIGAITCVSIFEILLNILWDIIFFDSLSCEFAYFVNSKSYILFSQLMLRIRLDTNEDDLYGPNAISPARGQ